MQSETDSETVGHIICQKATELSASCVLMGSHDTVALCASQHLWWYQMVAHQSSNKAYLVGHPKLHARPSGGVSLLLLLSQYLWCIR